MTSSSILETVNGKAWLTRGSCRVLGPISLASLKVPLEAKQSVARTVITQAPSTSPNLEVRAIRMVVAVAVGLVAWKTSLARVWIFEEVVPVELIQISAQAPRLTDTGVLLRHHLSRLFLRLRLGRNLTSTNKLQHRPPAAGKPKYIQVSTRPSRSTLIQSTIYLSLFPLSNTTGHLSPTASPPLTSTTISKVYPIPKEQVLRHPNRVRPWYKQIIQRSSTTNLLLSSVALSMTFSGVGSMIKNVARGGHDQLGE